MPFGCSSFVYDLFTVHGHIFWFSVSPHGLFVRAFVNIERIVNILLTCLQITTVITQHSVGRNYGWNLFFWWIVSYRWEMITCFFQRQFILKLEYIFIKSKKKENRRNEFKLSYTFIIIFSVYIFELFHKSIFINFFPQEFNLIFIKFCFSLRNMFLIYYNKHNNHNYENDNSRRWENFFLIL